MAIVSIENASKNYMLGNIVVPALKGINLEIQEGDFLSLAGPSGSGKTTLLNLIGCVDTPTEGKVWIQDQDTTALGDNDLTRLRHKTIGFIFQSFNLIPVLNVFENVEFPLLLGKPTPPEKERRARVEYLLEEVGLTDRMDHKPAELSGGQRQRVAIARALALQPKIVLADEPTANLDSKTSVMIIELMKKINKDENTTFLFSTHDPMITETVDHVIHILDGELAGQSQGVK